MTDGDMDLSERCDDGGLIHVVSHCGGDEAAAAADDDDARCSLRRMMTCHNLLLMTSRAAAVTIRGTCFIAGN